MGTKVNWIDIKDTLLGNHRKCFIWIRYVITLIAAFYGYSLKYIIGFFTNIQTVILGAKLQIFEKCILILYKFSIRLKA